MIRTLYLTISTLILVGSFAIPVYFAGAVAIPFGLMFYCFYALMTLVVTFISLHRGTTEGRKKKMESGSFGFLTFGSCSEPVRNIIFILKQAKYTKFMYDY